MIGFLRGRVHRVDALRVLLEVGGVGYRVTASPNTLSRLVVDAEALLYVHDHVREDIHDLYGFLSQEELSLFERLIGVSGVGPKVGMSMMSVGSSETVMRGIMNGDLALLTSAPGVGKKIAQKVILELKGQLVDVETLSGADGEVMDALISLGYSAAQAKQALKAIPTDITDVSERVREALRGLSG
jgi:holliday junction DNA helicase RuvA